MRVFSYAHARQSLFFSHTQDTCIEVSRHESSCVFSLIDRLDRVFSSHIHKIHVLKCRETKAHVCHHLCTDSTESLFSHTQDTCIEVSSNEGSCVSSLMQRLARVFSSRIHKIDVLKCRETKDHACLR